MNAKIMAMMMVGVMMFSGLAITMGNEDNTLDAVVGDGGAYSYTLTYHADQMANTAAQELQLTVADMTPISHASGTTTLSAVANEGSWAFNTTTGIGPFNSFYAAFDINDGNKLVSILDPYDLTKKIDGTSLGTMSNYNIMWVLPTVYWSVSDGNITLTNDPLSGGVAYAHTVDGNVYPYLAIGVYEGYADTVSGTTVLTSQSGVAPTVSTTRSNFLTYANNITMDDSLRVSDTVPAYAMLWNYYQWSLYKYCSYILMEGFNSQQIVGNGNIFSGSSASATGLTDSLGPYAGNPGSITTSSGNDNLYGINSVKLFIENAWGSVSEYIGGLFFVNNYPASIVVNTAHNPTSSTGTYVNTIGTTELDLYNTSSIKTGDQTWGLVDSGTTDYNCTKGLTDIFRGNQGDPNVGSAATSYGPGSGALYPGISYLGLDNGARSYIGARLAFVYGSPMVNVTIEDDGSGYGSVNDGTIEIEPGTEIEIDGVTNVLTIDYNNFVPTPISSTDQYTYAFEGWYDGATLLQNGDTINSDMIITAHFSRSMNDYTVTASASSYGSVSPASVTQPYGSAISASGNVLTIGSQTITATPDAADAQYTYTFTGWSTFPSTLTENTSVTANFDRTVNTYTITWSISGSTTSETLSYGEMPSHEDPVPPEGYLFTGWNPEIAAVTGDQTYTAVFEEIVYITVTFDPNGGQLEGSATKSVGIGTPYGELPTPKKDNNKFLGWYTDPEEGTLVTADTIVTADADQTLYAHWELTGFAAMLKPLLFLFPLILLAFLAIALVRTFA